MRIEIRGTAAFPKLADVIRDVTELRSHRAGDANEGQPQDGTENAAKNADSPKAHSVRSTFRLNSAKRLFQAVFGPHLH